MSKYPTCGDCESSYKAALVVGKILAYENKKTVKPEDYVEIELIADDIVFVQYVLEDDMYDYDGINDYLSDKFGKDMCFDEDDNHKIDTVCPNCKSVNYY